MASMLDQLVRKYAAPLLEEAGFDKIIARTFAKSAADGPVAIVRFVRSSGQPPAELFYLEVTLLSQVDIQWRESRRPVPLTPNELAAAHGSYFRRFPPPERLDAQAGESSFRERWLLHPTDAPVELCGEHVQKALRDEILPALDRLRDRREMLAAQQEQLPGMRLDDMVSILLRLPDGDTPELRRLIDRMATHAAELDERVGEKLDDPFLDWVREQVAQMSTAG